ncbi:MAG: 4-hydroxy-tetrahydrodipicolinate reductase, partial [Pseudorhodoplanes sp.]
MSDMRLIVAGAGGRMGRTLIRAIADAKGVTLSGALEEAGSPLLGRNASDLAGVGGQDILITDDAETLMTDADGIIDFTIPKATVALAKLAAKAGIVHVIGTTGFSAEDDAAVAEAAKKAVIVKSGNMSLGVNLLAALVRRVARTLDEDFDIEIVEMHHNRKIDAPSGTALLLGEAAAQGRGVTLQEGGVSTRHGLTGARKPGEFGFATLRGGTVVGDHNVIFAGAGERIELAHRAEDR